MSLDVIIVTEVTQNWQTFATWYSANEHLSDANISIKCIRGTETPFQFFQWTKRLQIPISYTKRVFEDDISNLLSIGVDFLAGSTSENDLLILTPKTMVLEEPKKFETSLCSEAVAYEKANEVGVKIMLNARQLQGAKVQPLNTMCKEAKETDEPTSIVSYKNGCGRWIDRLKGCPFSNAAGLASDDMTVNEHRIIETWKRLVPLYNATA